MRSLNLGILAHVDAGKTSLTERILFEAGVIEKPGSVDAGNTLTDNMALERERGITIKAAVVSFEVAGRIVNLIDTPGHPDFIAEVERVLGLLDAAILVVSAVEGVQAQTRVLVRALKRLGVPFLLFINKVDRLGARYDELLETLGAELVVTPVAMCEVRGAGSRLATADPCDLTAEPHRTRLIEQLADHDETLLADYLLSPRRIDSARLMQSLAGQVAQGRLHPAFAGAALSGIGVAALLPALADLLPARDADLDAPLSARIFKIERGWGGEKLAYLQLSSGRIALRQTLDLPAGPARVTGIHVFRKGRMEQTGMAEAGEIARLSGLATARSGDRIGLLSKDMKGAPGSDRTVDATFAPPTLETRVVACHPGDHTKLWLALDQLAEQDPLINLRRDEESRDLFLSLYGEVQKEVIAAMLQSEFSIAARFEESTVLYAERLIGIGEGLEIIFRAPNPYLATVGLRAEPRPPGSGNSFALEVDLGQMPAAFYKAVEETVFDVLKQGIFGWQIIDCHIALTAAAQTSPQTTAADFRGLTPLVLAEALEKAQTIVCEPVDRFTIDAPAKSLSPLLTLLGKNAAAVEQTEVTEARARLEGTMPAAKVQAIQQQLLGLTSGSGTMESAFEHYAPLASQISPPIRARTGPNPFDRKEYFQRQR
ncbi:translation factor GTPase family protein [Oryzifoliimicrobium ureilyticus]|uniref:translation factor GTPase family protein n=1 Tax=Oryzifoliimicrobium ureilyticus TaxID=3113724 RepID=UPI00307602A7